MTLRLKGSDDDVRNAAIAAADIGVPIFARMAQQIDDLDELLLHASRMNAFTDHCMRRAEAGTLGVERIDYMDPDVRSIMCALNESHVLSEKPGT
jgi:hypothetical protein